MSIILKPFAWLLLQMYRLLNNYGLALILFAVLVKLILFPFSLKGKKSMIKTTMLNSKMQKLQKMYGNNTARYNEELQKLYEKEGVNPMSGCLWSMLPLIILIPLYGVIRQPMQYMMSLTAEQISAVAAALNWSDTALSMGWIKEAAEYVTGAYNELFLSSLINEGNLAAAQAAAGEGAKVLALNFNFLGIDLSQIPTWKFWANGMDWTTIGLFLLVLVSAVSGFVSSKISMKTNEMNSGPQSAQAAQTNRTMLWTMPLVSLWIGFSMPGLLCVYWIANNVLGVAQELIASKLLKKEYAKARAAQAEEAARAKEEEKARRREAAEKKAQAAEEARKNKKLRKQQEAEDNAKDTAFIAVSRVGMRPYARGRAYDPDRFGGVTAYRDPSAPVDEAAVEAARTAKEQKAEEAEKAALEALEREAAQEEETVLTETAPETVEETAAPALEESVEEAVESAAENADGDKE